MKIRRCNTAYTHDGTGVGVAMGPTRAAAARAARRQAQAMASTLPSAWIRAELTACPKGCPDGPYYSVSRRGNTRVIAEADLLNGLWLAVAVTPWRITYWCGALPASLRARRRRR